MRAALYSILFAFLSITISYSQTSLEGRVTDSATGAPLPFSTVAIYHGDVLITGVEVDLEGNYVITEIEEGKYNVEATYHGYTAQKQIGVIIKEGINKLDFGLSEGVLMDAVEINEYKAPLIDRNNTTSGATITAESIRSLPTKKINAMASSVSGVTTSSDPSMRGKRIRGSMSYIGGVTTSEPFRFERSELPKSGQITAGEWNDLHNWKDWMSLLEEDNYSIMMERHEIYTMERYSVIVVNKSNAVLANVPVQLLDQDGNTIWETFTDNAGKAELWGNAIEKGQNASAIKVRGKQKQDIVKIEDGSNTIVLEEDCYSPDMMDIVFVVDATSSMNDEILYLKSELLDVIDRIEDANDNIDFNLGSIFYRDTQDEYLTRVSPLTSRHEETIEFVGNQNSKGGGDNPEAVEAALEETLKLSWREDALKLVFLVLDAPPHEDDATMAKIRSQIKEAATRGIKLIPITASGIDRNTEFLMKFMAILTNGTYVFITDDSGIGNPHLDPVVDDYEVEKLNDCIVRLIVQYSKSYSCEAEKIEENEGVEVSVFPNPATQFINIKTNAISNKIKIYSSNGMMVKSITPSEKETRVELNELVNGIYSISIFFEDSVETKQIILLK